MNITKKNNDISSNSDNITTVFDRLSKQETYASADRKKGVVVEDGKRANSTTSITSGSISNGRRKSVASSIGNYSYTHSQQQPTATPTKSNNNNRNKKHKSSPSSVFERLSTCETFASADKKGKISRVNIDRTTKVLSTVRNKLVYSTEQHSDDYNNNEDGTPDLMSPERNAIANLQLRIKIALSVSDDSQEGSVMTPLHRNNSNDRCLRSRPIGEDEVEDQDDEEIIHDKLFNLIWNKDFDAADAFLNDSYLTAESISKALYYQNQDGWNALMRAFYKRPPKYICAPDSLIKSMIEMGGKELVTMTNLWGDNALVCAIRNKRSLALIQLLLETGGGREYVLQPNFRGRTPLHWACDMNASIDVVKCLVEIGGKELIMMEDDVGVLAHSKSVDVMDYLMKIGGDLNKKPIPKRPTVLHDLIQEKLFDQVEAYLDDENINLYGKRSAMAHKDENGWTPLMFAVLKNAPDSIIEKIIIIGNDEILSITNKWENIALLYALAQNRSFHLIRLFVEKGGGMQCIAKAYGKGLTPLHWACKHNSSVEIINFLIEEGGHEGKQHLVSMKCNYNQVPLHLSLANGPKASGDVVRLLVGICDGSILQEKDKGMKLPIHIACEEKVPLEIIKCLVDQGLNNNLMQVDNEGKIPLHVACEKRASLDTILYLAEVGGKQSVDKVPFMVKNAVHGGVLLTRYS